MEGIRLPESDSEYYKLTKVYQTDLDSVSTKLASEKVLGTINRISIDKPDNFIVAQMQSNTYVDNGITGGIAYNYKAYLGNHFMEENAAEAISREFFTNNSKNNFHQFKLDDLPVGMHSVSIRGARLRSTGGADTHKLYFNTIYKDSTLRKYG